MNSLINTDPDLADISRIFCEVIRSEFNISPTQEIVIHQKTYANNDCNKTTVLEENNVNHFNGK